TLHRLVDAMHDDHLRGNDVEILATGVTHLLHVEAALGTSPKLSRNAVVRRNPLERIGQRIATGRLAPRLLRLGVLRSILGRTRLPSVRVLLRQPRKT